MVPISLFTTSFAITLFVEVFSFMPQKYEGDTQFKFVCSVPAPVCGSDFRTYDNICLLGVNLMQNPNLHLSHLGTCSPQTIQPNVLKAIVKRLGTHARKPLTKTKELSHPRTQDFDILLKRRPTSRNLYIPNFMPDLKLGAFVNKNKTHLWTNNGKVMSVTFYDNILLSAIGEVEGAKNIIGNMSGVSNELETALTNMKKLVLEDDNPENIVNDNDIMDLDLPQ